MPHSFPFHNLVIINFLLLSIHTNSAISSCTVSNSVGGVLNTQCHRLPLGIRGLWSTKWSTIPRTPALGRAGTGEGKKDLLHISIAGRKRSLQVQTQFKVLQSKTIRQLHPVFKLLSNIVGGQL